MTVLQSVGLVLLFGAVFATGVRLRRAGWPYGAVVLAVHKLGSLAALALSVQAAYRSVDLGAIGTVATVALCFAGIGFVSAVATGGVLSTQGRRRPAVPVLHRIASSVTVIATAASLYLLLVP